MFFFTVTASNGSKALINSDMVNKVVDFGNCRAIYQGNNTNIKEIILITFKLEKVSVIFGTI